MVTGMIGSALRTLKAISVRFYSTLRLLCTRVFSITSEIGGGLVVHDLCGIWEREIGFSSGKEKPKESPILLSTTSEAFVDDIAAWVGSKHSRCRQLLLSPYVYHAYPSSPVPYADKQLPSRRKVVEGSV